MHNANNGENLQLLYVVGGGTETRQPPAEALYEVINCKHIGLAHGLMCGHTA